MGGGEGIADGEGRARRGVPATNDIPAREGCGGAEGEGAGVEGGVASIGIDADEAKGAGAEFGNATGADAVGVETLGNSDTEAAVVEDGAAGANDGSDTGKKIGGVGVGAQRAAIEDGDCGAVASVDRIGN